MENTRGWAVFRRRPLFFPAWAFILGCFFGPSSDISGHFILLAAGALLFFSVLRREKWGGHLLLLAACLLSGLGLSRLEARESPPSGRKATLEGVVERMDTLPYGPRLTLAVARFNEAPAAFRTQLYAQGNLAPVLPGQRILVPVRWSPLQPPQNPGEPDRLSQRARQGIAYAGSFDARALVPLSSAPFWQRWLHRTHTSLKAQATRLSPGPDAAALYLTLAAGLRASLGPNLEEEFSASGLAHLLSVSGLHVAVLAMVLVWLLRVALIRLLPNARRFDVRRVAAPLGIPLIWAYVIFTGNQGPAVRSAFMASLVMLSMALWKNSDGLNTLCAAALAVLALAPAAVGELSMQLSFLAVLSLILLTPLIREWFPQRLEAKESDFRYWLGKTQEAITQTFCASLAVTLGAAPLVAATFGRISIAGLLSNVVCMPLSALLTALAAGGAALHVIWPPLANPFVFLGTHASEWLLSISHFFAHVPGAVWAIPGMHSKLAVMYWLGLFLWVVANGNWRRLSWMSMLAVGLAFIPPSFFRRQTTSVTFLSVGQGDGIVLSSNGHHALIDAGGVPKGGDTGLRYVLPFLRHEGISRLDLAVLSHPHPDHALGLVSTLRETPTQRLWFPRGASEGSLTESVTTAARMGSDADNPTTVETVEAHRPVFQLGEFKLHVLGPPKDRALLEGVNDLSIVIRATHGNVSFLLTGDIEEAGEEALITEPVTVVKAPHHGSRTSSTPGFLAQARPRYAVFCVGKHNRFSFPHPDVVSRYEALGTQCFRTDQHGAITFESDGHDVVVKTFHVEEDD